MDGSHHRWLGEDGPQFALLFAVDDATGCVVNARFCEQEDGHNYLLLMQGLLRRYGIPLAFYTDHHPVFKHRSEYQPTGTPTHEIERQGRWIGFAVSVATRPTLIHRTAGLSHPA